MTEHWEVFLSREGTLIRADLGIREIVPIDGANTLIRVEIRTRSLFSRKLDYELIGIAEDEIVSQLIDEDHLVGAVTYADCKSFFFYTMQEKRLFNMLDKVLSKYRKLKCEISVMDDPGWEYYLQNLYPDSLEKQRILDQKVVEQLKANHDNHHIPREIKHWIYFKDSREREDFKNSLNLNFYRIVEENTQPDRSEHSFELILSHTGTAEFETITPFTTELLEKAMRVGGNYDGWESPVMLLK
ncbi:MAG: hypothetical protein K0R57_532 [Paenibacillaceae bacterium]|jgi:hypothetical protein|nr:hypothetical protein [Paenibacillaceae bacterium]